MLEISCKNQKLIATHRVCCFDNESITARISLDDNNVIEINFYFFYDNNVSNYTISSTENGKVNINLYNFASGTGTGIKRPVQIGKLNEKMISIVFFVYLFPEANPILDFSLYLEV